VSRDPIFDLQPHLSAALVSLRPLEAQDYAALYAVASDPLIWEQHPARDRHQEPVFRRFFEGAIESGSAFAVREASAGRVIGTSRYAAFSAERSEIEIGWTFLAREYWGGRHNAEVKRLMLAHAFRFVDTVFFEVHVDNIRSQRAVLKLGARRDRSSGPPDDETVVFRLAGHDYRGGAAGRGN